MSTEVCSNCETQIGKLETPRVWKEHVVCAACYRKLSADKDDVIEGIHREVGPAVMPVVIHDKRQPGEKAGLHPLIIAVCVVFLVIVGMFLLKDCSDSMKNLRNSQSPILSN